MGTVTAGPGLFPLVTGVLATHQAEWAVVGDHLVRYPDSVAGQVLDNSLMLSLTRATYRGRNPSVLVDEQRFPTSAALREHLIDQLLVRSYPDERAREHATAWLCWIVHHLGTGRDLAWWSIPTWVSRKRLSGIVTVVAAGVAGVAMEGGRYGGYRFGVGVAPPPPACWSRRPTAQARPQENAATAPPWVGRGGYDIN